MKMMTLMSCAFAALATFAHGQGKDSVKENASNPVVEEVLSQPDGVSIVRNEKDGSLQIFARGSASYDFGDVRDIRAMTKVAELRAKAALSKFNKECLIQEESASSGESRLVKTILTQTADGEIKNKNVTRENAEVIKETLVVRSAAILSGVVILKTIKIPSEGSKTSGEIQVTIGISTKTLDAAAEVHNMITDSINGRREIGEKGQTGQKSAGEVKGQKEGAVGEVNQNKPEVRINNTLF